MTANIINALGTALLLANVEPLIAYAVVGIGAATFSPTKYGILPELASHDLFVKANSWVKDSTLLAILSGMAIGAQMADYSITLALNVTMGLFLISAITTLFLPAQPDRLPNPE